MKRFLAVLLFCLVTFTLNSCRSDVEPAYYVQAKAGNDTFDYEGDSYVATSTRTNLSTFFLGVYPDADKFLTFSTDRPLTGRPETLRINYAEYSQDGKEYYYSSSGSCTITRLENNVVEGTFYFDAYHTKTFQRLRVQDGRFRLKYN